MRMRTDATTVRRRFRTHRSLVRLPASVVTLSAYRYLEVMDISKRGAKLQGSKLPEVGSTALFRLGPLQAMCRVVWADSEQCGIQFDEPLEDALLARFQREGSDAILEARPDEQGY